MYRTVVPMSLWTAKSTQLLCPNHEGREALISIAIGLRAQQTRKPGLGGSLSESPSWDRSLKGPRTFAQRKGVWDVARTANISCLQIRIVLPLKSILLRLSLPCSARGRRDHFPHSYPPLKYSQFTLGGTQI